jgi:hypothetical protein
MKHPARPGAPPPFCDAMTTEVYLCGTAHVSSRSCEEVTSLIRAVRPDAVMAELCPQRLAMLCGWNDGDVFDQEQLLQRAEEEQNAVEEEAKLSLGSVRKMGVTGALLVWMQAKSARALAVKPGEEFRCALREARRLSSGGGLLAGQGQQPSHHCDFMLLDRPCSITLRRLFESLSRWQRVRLIASVVWSGLFLTPRKLTKWLNKNLDDEKSITQEILELGKAFPPVVTTLIKERDAFMVRRVRECAVVKRPKRVVVVVGAGHVNGMADLWDSLVNAQAATNSGGGGDGSSSSSSSNDNFDPSGDFSQSAQFREEYSTLPVCVSDDMLAHVDALNEEQKGRGSSSSSNNNNNKATMGTRTTTTMATAGEGASEPHGEPGAPPSPLNPPLRFADGERVLVWSGEGLPQRGHVLCGRYRLEEADRGEPFPDGSYPMPKVVAYLVQLDESSSVDQDNGGGVLAVPFDDEACLSRDDFLAGLPLSRPH